MSGWYLKSTSGDKSWSDALTEWGWSYYTMYKYIFELKGAPISQGASLTNSNWNAIEITGNPILKGDKAYWVKINHR